MLHGVGIDPCTVVLVIKGKEIIGTGNIFIFHPAAVLHVIDKHINGGGVIRADLAKSHSIIIEAAFFIVRRYLVMMIVYYGLALISEVKLNAGIVRHHKGGFCKQLLIA